MRNVEGAGGLGLELAWKAFSLEQVNLPPEADADELWTTASERRGLVPLAAAKWAEAQGPEVFASVHLAFFEARHVDREKIGRPDVAAGVLDRAGVDGPSVVDEVLSDRRWLEAARSDHREADEAGIFGVPTLVFPGCPPVFLRLLEITEGDRAVDIYRRVRENAADPVFHEFKRPAG